MFQKLLVAIDDSDSSLVALSFTVALAKDSGPLVDVLHVTPPLGMKIFAARTENAAVSLVQEAVLHLREHGVAATGLLARANALNVPHAIVDAALQQRSSAIIVGSGQSRGIHRFFGRGVRERVTRLSTLPILTSPPPLEAPKKRFWGVQHDLLTEDCLQESFR